MKDFSDLPLRPCVGVMLLNAQGKVWIGRRISKPHDNRDQFIWQMPQGGIDKGEEPLEAAYRELEEETGVTSVTLLQTASDWLTYELPKNLWGKALKGKYRGQRQQWFVMRFEGQDSEIDIDEKPKHRAEFDQWKWARAETLPDLIVPFKRHVYQQVIEEFDDYLLK